MQIKRPIPVTVVGWLYVLVGVGSTTFHILEFRKHPPTLLAATGICGLGVAALIAGIFLLRGKDWARWLALLWMAFHVAVSALNSRDMLLMHAALFLLFLYILLGREARAYFRPGPTPAA
jgi:hypothetical protein